MQFIPDDPYSTDYDIKVIKSNFNSTDVGIGTTSIGFIDLTGSNKKSSSGISTSIISVDSSKFSSLLANVEITDSTANSINFVEVYLNHDGTNTYISEYYFDSESSSKYSGNFIGTFGANISSGILSLNYKNNSSNIVDIRSRIVGFGTTAVGVGAHRFNLPNQIVGNERSAIYQSTYSSTVSLASTIISLNKSNFNAVKSLVEVSVGSTSALHQVMMIHDNNDIYVQQSPFLSIGSTSGIGTFGGHIFKEGSMVIPGNIAYDGNFNSVKLNSSNFGVDVSLYIKNFIGKKVTGQISGTTATIQFISFLMILMLMT